MRRLVLAAALVLLVLPASAVAHSRLSFGRARAAVVRYAGPPRVAVGSCARRGPGRVACWASGSCPECGEGWGFDWLVVVTRRADGSVWAHFDSFVDVRV